MEIAYSLHTNGILKINLADTQEGPIVAGRSHFIKAWIVVRGTGWIMLIWLDARRRHFLTQSSLMSSLAYTKHYN